MEHREQGQGFAGFGIAPGIAQALVRLNILSPTPIQSKSIPVGLEGKDIIGIAQTGTGKTLAFGIPLVQRLFEHGGKGLVLLPTRELALQVAESLGEVGHALGLRVAVLIGGDSMARQVAAVRRNPHVIIATPGRLNDHLLQRTVTLSAVKMLVLDEADRMLDMGFAPQIKKILAVVPRDRQTLLFSATMPDEIVGMAREHMKLPVRVEIAPAGTAAERVTHELFFVDRPTKRRLLEKVLGEYKGSVLVFARTKFGAKNIARWVRDIGHSATEIHSNRSLAQRKEALQGFKRGTYRVLVATDIAARGIDVNGIELVINYDLPQSPEDYVHRIGRTGRAGAAGHAISFATPDQRGDVRAIERVMRIALPPSRIPEGLPPERPSAAPAFAEREPRRFSPRGGGGRRPPARSFGGSRGGFNPRRGR